MIDFSVIVRKLVDSGAAKASEVAGCTEGEIEELESAVGAKLPQVYREFLSRMGRSAGQLFLGTDIFFEHLRRGLTKGANLLLARDGKPPLPKKAFVFGMHQGYQFTFFLLGENEDPTVEGYLEKDDFSRVAGSFSEFLTQAVEDTIRTEQILLERRKLVAARRQKLPSRN